MQSVVIVIHLMIVLAMIGVVLLQKSEGGGLGMGSAGAGFMTNRGAANVLTRATAFLAAGFFFTSLLLSVIAGLNRNPTSIINPGGTPTNNAPGSPANPGGTLLDQLRQQEGAPAPAPAPTPAPAPAPAPP
jgi:preprotein translocase subunit SecG